MGRERRGEKGGYLLKQLYSKNVCTVKYFFVLNTVSSPARFYQLTA